MILLVFYWFVIGNVIAATQPWYHTREVRNVSSNSENNLTFKCEKECSTTMDCPTGLSCFQATNDSKGCCLRALKPNETGCVMDDQCKRACESTHCDKTQSPPRCLCDAGSHFLFNKCWKKCPDFAHAEPSVDSTGFSQCILKVDSRTALNYMRRFRRQMRSNFC